MKYGQALACAAVCGVAGLASAQPVSASFLEGVITGGGFPGPSAAKPGTIVDTGGSGGGSTGGGLGQAAIRAAIEVGSGSTLLSLVGTADHVDDSVGYTAAGTGKYDIDQEPFTTQGSTLVFSLDEPATYSVSDLGFGTVDFRAGTGTIDEAAGTLSAGTYLIDVELRATPAFLHPTMDWSMTLTGVPAPASAAGLGLGAVLLGARRRR